METKRTYEIEALEYIAKIAAGGMRDAISLMDKCMSYNRILTLKNVVKALGTVDYDVMMNLTDAITADGKKLALEIIENMYAEGKDIKQFVAQYVQFLLDIQKYSLTQDMHFVQIPGTQENKDWLDSFGDCQDDLDKCMDLLKDMLQLNAKIKWSQSAKYDLEATILLF